MDIQNYIELITPEHRGKPKYTAMLTAFLNMLADCDAFLSDIEMQYVLQIATGVNLDTLGQWIGLRRKLNFNPSDGSSPILDDDTYRTLLLSRIAQNNWNGKLGTMPEIWGNIFNSEQLAVRDNQDMTMTVMVTGMSRTPLKEELVLNGYIVPKPSTVRLKVITHEQVKQTAGLAVALGLLDSMTITVRE